MKKLKPFMFTILFTLGYIAIVIVITWGTFNTTKGAMAAMILFIPALIGMSIDVIRHKD